MSRFYIYEEEMYGDDYQWTESGQLGDTTPLIIDAETKEEAKSKFLQRIGMAEDDEDAWRFYAVDIKSLERFKCDECGKLFGYPKIVRESRGEYWGIPCQETVAYCPHCGGSAFYEVTTLS